MGISTSKVTYLLPWSWAGMTNIMFRVILTHFYSFFLIFNHGSVLTDGQIKNRKNFITLVNDVNIKIIIESLLIAHQKQHRSSSFRKKNHILKIHYSEHEMHITWLLLPLNNYEDTRNNFHQKKMITNQ